MKTRKILSLLLALAMVLSLLPGVLPMRASAEVTYDLWINGVQVTASNANDLADEGIAFYDPFNNVLYMIDAVFNGGSFVTEGTTHSSGIEARAI